MNPNVAVVTISICLGFAMEAAWPSNTFDVLSKQLSPPCEYSGKFKQIRRLSSLPQPLESSGEFVFSCQRGLIWQTTDPLQDTIIYTIKPTVIQIDENGSTRALTGTAGRRIGRILLELMSGNTGFIEDNFVTESRSSTNGWVFQPKSDTVKKYIFSLELQATTEKTVVVIRGNDDATTRIETNAYIAHSQLTAPACIDQISVHQETACQYLLDSDAQETLLNPDK